MSRYLKSIMSKLSNEGRSALDAAVCHAASRRQVEVMPEHVLLALIQQESVLLESLGLQAGLLANTLLDETQKVLDGINGGKASMPVFSPELEKWLTNSWLLASASWGQVQINPAVLLASLLQDDGEHVCAPGCSMH
ncbi:Clp protease N-terminal domain-containing protein [Mangrovibacter sp. SLW1]